MRPPGRRPRWTKQEQVELVSTPYAEAQSLLGTRARVHRGASRLAGTLGALAAAMGDLSTFDKAMGWTEYNTAKDRDGFLGYRRPMPSGLASQGWKNSWNGFAVADGRIAREPLVLGEVQGYVHTAAWPAR